jgi:single-stranded-DNA-specific exonuclease
MMKNLTAAMENALVRLRQWPAEAVDLFHHNDSDGLTSAAILTRAFDRAGFSVRRVCLEKPYPAVLEKIFAVKGKLVVFADFAGRIAPLIAKLNRGGNLVVILDHHKAQPSDDPMVLNLDPELFGIRGDLEISASTTCYHFACLMDPANQDLAALAVVGAVGDGFFRNGKLTGPNRDAALEAVDRALLRIEVRDGKELYLLETDRGIVNCAVKGEYLDTLGGAGYSKSGPEMGVRVCLEGISKESDLMIAELQDIRKTAFSDQISRITHGGMYETVHIQWMDVGNRFRPMGVKMIGVFLDEIKSFPSVNPEKFLAGFMEIPDWIPGLGEFAFGQVKVSMRVPPAMEEKIRAGKHPGLDTFLPEATSRLGGFSDACHSLTAATTVPVGGQKALIDAMERILSAKR